MAKGVGGPSISASLIDFLVLQRSHVGLRTVRVISREVGLQISKLC